MGYQYLIGSLLFLGVWLILFVGRRDLRKQMWFASLLAMPLGLTEPLWVPSYWNPQPVLGVVVNGWLFDLEGLLFAFAVGGVAAVVYEEFLQKKLRRRKRVVRLEELALGGVVVLVVFLLSLFFLSTIIAACLAMMAGVIVSFFTRPDLHREIVLGGVYFALCYFAILVLLNVFLFPGWVSDAWNLDALTGVLVFGVPIEEGIFALLFGMLWAPIYEEVCGYTVH